tara:strand:- start:572 stop:715 length:144 start_codon:yes stop_codon:yes gene_type:complete
MGAWTVEFPEEMEKSEINRIMIRIFRILETDGITVTKKDDDTRLHNK